MIGVDIINISRFKRLADSRNGPRFLMRVFTPMEIGLFKGNENKIWLLTLAGCFALKEAVIKASQGELSLADLQNIEIYMNKNGAINVNILDLDVRCKNYWVSVSYEEKYAIAIAAKIQWAPCNS